MEQYWRGTTIRNSIEYTRLFSTTKVAGLRMITTVDIVRMTNTQDTVAMTIAMTMAMSTVLIYILLVLDVVTIIFVMNSSLCEQLRIPLLREE